ncbi:ethanolamine ammonia-lyase subunit EutC [Nocardia sp. alder85J]|uniref:ethanolamine ammonia-lyase subunit EutC n=1 Tax=Nocardia sp. alder85J TaxID=2862949 RepID=UPI001CD320BA|nr:ethanolamine ammonia-lyase subunit EutC [Nocardia sp. alder85J]MCX4094851.1 ethanolamine ammonia-lyase subunit EutC [Nocardia sp. alder85J]
MTTEEHPETGAASEFWAALRRTTQARIGLGRAGDALPTARVLELRAAHAAARDAVHTPLDTTEFADRVRGAGLGEPLLVRSRAGDRSEYLRRPDLGRLPESAEALAALPSTGAEIGVVLADGLSPRALAEHGIPTLLALKDALAQHYRFAPPVIATQARVALGDHIGPALDVATVLVLIGERPGLSVADSLGIYLTHLPRPGRTDAERNCVSNIHPPEGLGYAAAAAVTAGLIAGARRLGRSGVELKDTSVRGGTTIAAPDDPAVAAGGDPGSAGRAGHLDAD